MSTEGSLDDAIALTIDVDWVPDPVLEDTIDLLDSYGISATIFSTHDDGLTLSEHERALHPNFSKDSPPAELVGDLAAMYPSARGVRSHSLEISASLRSAYPDQIRYESNYMLFAQTGIAPFWMTHSILQVPIYFMDDIWLRHGAPPLSPQQELDKQGLRVYCFHPVHIFLNTPTIEYYERHKDAYQDPDALREVRYDGEGVRDTFVSLLEALDREERTTWQLGAIADTYSDQVPYESGVEL